MGAGGLRSLSDRVPVDGLPSRDAALEVFLEWVADAGIDLYPAQEEAILELFSGRHVILKTPTGSGKSLVATAFHFLGLARGRRSFYTSPIKALVSEKFFDLCDEFDALNIGLMTGDSTVNRDAPIVCCTAEIVANMAVRQGAGSDIRQVVMDEFHYYGDRDRGMAWQVPLLALERAQFLLMSATLGDTADIERELRATTGTEVSVVESDTRPVPLDFSYRETALHETLDDLVQRNLAPIYLVHFSQRDATDQAQALMSTNYCTKAEKAAISDEIGDTRFDTPFGKVIRRYLGHGVGLHHAGLLPKYRLLTERLARRGLLKIISGTDTLGVGVNVPIRTVLFTRLCKYDGDKVQILTVRDFKQIAGRAGRKGYDDKGWVVCQAPEHVIENKKLSDKLASGAKKKVVRKKPPTHNFVMWTEETFQQLLERPPERLQSVFDLDHGVLINALQQQAPSAGAASPPPTARGGGYRALIQLIERSHEGTTAKSRLRRKARQIFRSLRHAELVHLVPNPHGRGQRLAISDELQSNFSLFHDLSLFLVHALDMLRPEEPEYPYQVVSLVEAILENPRPVLIAQERKAKDLRIAELKADGVEYEERMAELEKVTWPKPLEEILYPALEAFAAKHPWLDAGNVKPKSIARDMAERYVSFNDYVRELGIQKVEGVLLRYLSMAYKTLAQGVPEVYHTDELLDVIAYLRSTIERVDSSLVAEWERMALLERTGVAPAATPAAAPAPPPPPDISRDAKAFAARVRADLHGLVKALAARDWEEAEACVHPATQWTAERWQQAFEPYYDDYPELIADQRARYNHLTQLTPAGDHRWQVRHTLVDPEGDHLWALTGHIDLTQDTAPEGPLVRLDDVLS